MQRNQVRSRRYLGHGTRYDLGASLHDAGREVDAARCYRRAISLNPRDGAAHNNLAAAALDGGDVRAAVAGWRAAIAVDPHNADAALSAASMLLTIGKCVDIGGTTGRFR